MNKYFCCSETREFKLNSATINFNSLFRKNLDLGLGLGLVGVVLNCWGLILCPSFTEGVIGDAPEATCC